MLGKRCYHTFIEASSFISKDVNDYCEIEQVGLGTFG